MPDGSAISDAQRALDDPKYELASDRIVPPGAKCETDD
jgi:hypothetical protein